MNNAKTWDFHGGLHIPDHKSDSNVTPIQGIALPKRLVLPLAQHIGAPGEPLVQVGDSVKKGQLIAQGRGMVSANLHAPSSGNVVDISEQPIPHPSGLNAPCIVIETDGQDTWSDDLPQPMPDYAQRTPDEIRERIRWAGIVGLGGATFPTSVKVNPGKNHGIKTLILNGAECEPFITCDDRLMRERADRIVAGLAILKHLLDPGQCLIGTEDNKPEAAAALNQALQTAGLTDVKVVQVPTKYPSGGERQLIKLLTGKEVPSQGIPAQIGILVQNVATAAAIADAVLDGKPLIGRVVTVTGSGVGQRGNFDVPFGTLATDLIEQAGGYNAQASHLIQGGPMMGFGLHGDRVPVTKGTNCYLVASEAEAPTPPAASSCIRCGQCQQVCPAELLPQQLYWHARAKAFDKIQDFHLFDCIECGCCAQVCPSHIPLVQYYRFAKTSIWAQEEEKKKSERARQRHQAREARLARIAAERKAKMRKKKEDLEKPKPGAGDKTDAKQAAIEAAKQRAAAKKAEAKAENATQA